MELITLIFLGFIGWITFGIYTKLEDIEKLLAGEEKPKKAATKKSTAKSIAKSKA